jgi:hypothetical protein
MSYGPYNLFLGQAPTISSNPTECYSFTVTAVLFS